MFPNKMHVFVARFAVALGFVTSCSVNTCYAILCCFQFFFSCMQQSMMDDGDDETFPSITVTVRKPPRLPDNFRAVSKTPPDRSFGHK